MNNKGFLGFDHRMGNDSKAKTVQAAPMLKLMCFVSSPVRRMPFCLMQEIDANLRKVVLKGRESGYAAVNLSQKYD